MNSPVPIVVAGFGASTVRGWRPGLGNHETFRALLEKDLAALGLNVVMTDAAQPGNNVLGGLQRFERDVLVPNPDGVLIDFAINDSSPRKADPNKNRVSLSTYKEIHEFFFDSLEQRKIPFFVVTGQKMATPDADERNVRLLPYVETMRSLAIERSIPLVDLYQRLEEAGAAGTDLRELYLDGMHFNARGNRFVADAILEFEKETSFFAGLSRERCSSTPL